MTVAFLVTLSSGGILDRPADPAFESERPLGPVAPVPHVTVNGPRLPANGSGHVEPSVLDFGAVGHGVRQTLEFELHGPRAEASKWAKPRATCSCITIEFDHSTALPPGASRRGKVHVRFGRGRGHFGKKVIFERADGRPAVTLNLNATFLPGVRWTANDVRLEVSAAAELKDSSTVFTVELPMRSSVPSPDAPSTPEANGSGSEAATARLVLDGIEGNDTSRLTAEVRPLDSRNFEVTVRSRAAGMPARQVVGTLVLLADGLPLRIPVHVYEHGAVRCEPYNVAVPRATTVEALRQTLVITALDARAFKIMGCRHETGVGTSRAGAKRLRSVVQYGAVWDRESSATEHSIALSPKLLTDPDSGESQTRGRLSGTVVIETDHPSMPELRVSVVGFVALTSKD